MMKVYMHCEPVTFMHRMFRHKYDQINIQSEIFLERGILNYNSLEYQKVSKLIFQVALNEQKDKLDKENKRISKANFDAVDLALENVIELFKILRKYFSEDAIHLYVSNVWWEQLDVSIPIKKNFIIIILNLLYCSIRNSWILQFYQAFNINFSKNLLFKFQLLKVY